MSRLLLFLTVVLGVIPASFAESFRNPTRLSLPHTPQHLAVIDLNGDGRPDLVVVTQITPSITPQRFLDILLAQPDGSFVAMPEIVLPLNTSYDCVTADINSDGKPDIVCPNFDTIHFSPTASVLTYFGNGDGSFRSPVSSSFTSTNSGFNSFAIAGEGVLLNQGHTDLILTGNDTFSYRLQGDGAGDFTLHNSVSAIGPAVVADVNGDGKSDLLYSIDPYILLGRGDGTFSSGIEYGEYGNCLFQDVDGDGHLDAICGDLGQSVVVLHGNADGSFSSPLTLSLSHPLPLYVAPLAYTDLNHDGIADLVGLSSDGLTVMLGRGGLSFADPAIYPAGVLFPSVYNPNAVAADMNGDGVVDLVTAGDGAILITYGRADGTFNNGPAFQSGNRVTAATVADFNKDGIPDVATTGDTAINLRLGLGDGTFGPITQLPALPQAGFVGGTPVDVFVHGDFNGDGKQDILASAHPSTTYSLYYESYLLLGNGDGTFATPADSHAVLPASQTTVADLNQDGRDDLLASTGQSLIVTLAAPDGTFANTAVSSPLPQDSSNSNAPKVALADFNNDGLLDAMVAEDNLYFLPGNGDGSFAAATSIALPPAIVAPPSLVVGDFDGDDNADVAVLTYNNSLLVFFGNGDGTFSAPVTAATFPAAVYNPIVADLNGDGRDDLILTTGTDLYTTAVSVLTLYSLSNRTFDNPTFFEAGTNPVSATASDLNRDGFPDLLFTNNSSNAFTPLLNLPGAVVGHTLTAAPEPSLISQPFTLTATFTPPAGATETQLAGNVTFFVDRGAIGTSPIQNNTATLPGPTGLSVGRHSVSAVWPGDSVYASLISHSIHSVSKIPVTLALAAQPNPAISGLPVALQIAISNSISGAPAPTGSFSFTDGSTVLASGPIASAPQSVSATYTRAATHQLMLTYSGDATHAANSTTLSLVVQPAPTTTALTVSPNPTAYGSSFTLTATVTPTLSSSTPAFASANTGTITLSGLPTGAVILPVSFSSARSASTPMTVTRTINSSVAPGAYSLVATFSGTTDLLASISASIGETVSPPPSITSVTVVPSPGLQAHSVSVQVAVSGQLATPNGAVQITDGTTVLGSVNLSAGAASLATDTLSVGTHTLSATYSGDSENTASGAMASETILPYDFTISATPASVSASAVTPATVSLTATAVGAFTEPVTFSLGTVPAGLSLTLAQPTVSVSPGGSASTTMGVAVTPIVAATKSTQLQVVSMAGLVLFLFGPLFRGRSAAKLPAILALSVVALFLSGCGSHTKPVVTSTYSVQVTALSAHTQQSQTISISVVATH